MQQDAVQTKGRATAGLQQAQQQQAQSNEHLALLKKQLAEERQQEAALSANLDSMQAELVRYKTQVEHCLSVLTSCQDDELADFRKLATLCRCCCCTMMCGDTPHASCVLCVHGSTHSLR